MKPFLDVRVIKPGNMIPVGMTFHEGFNASSALTDRTDKASRTMTNYPSSHRKSTSTVPTNPFQLQTCNLIHQSTASITYLLEATTETPRTPQIWLDSLTFMRTKYQNQHQTLPQPRSIYNHAMSYTNRQQR